MTKPKMFSRGQQYRTFDEFLQDYRDFDGSRYVFWCPKLMHINFVGGMSLNTIIEAVRRGVLYRAVWSDNRCGAYAESWEELGKPKGWRGCSLPKGHAGPHRSSDDD